MPDIICHRNGFIAKKMKIGTNSKATGLSINIYKSILVTPRECVLFLLFLSHSSLCLSRLNCKCVSSPHFDIQMCLTGKG